MCDTGPMGLLFHFEIFFLLCKLNNYKQATCTFQTIVDINILIYKIKYRYRFPNKNNMVH